VAPGESKQIIPKIIKTGMGRSSDFSTSYERKSFYQYSFQVVFLLLAQNLEFFPPDIQFMKKSSIQAKLQHIFMKKDSYSHVWQWKNFLASSMDRSQS